MTAPLQILVQVFTGRLLNAALEGVFLAGLVWIFLRVARRQNSGTRFVIWFSALIAIGFLPLLSGAFFATATRGSLSNFHPRILLESSLAAYLFAAWAAIAGLLLLRLAVGLLRLVQVRRNCVPLHLAALDPEIADVCRDFKSARRATLCASEDITVPAAIGFFRPAVVFPARLFASLSTEEIKAILLHELAHLRRYDDWTNLAQKIVKAVFFFHPAVWWIDNHLTLEREMACDDVVLAETKSPRVYASSLISFAEKLQNSRRPALVQALVSRVSDMTLRVAQILNAKRSGSIALWKPALGLSSALIAAVLLATSYLPTVVAFRPDAPLQSPIQASHIPPAPTAVAVHQNTIAPARTAPRPRAIAAAFHPRERVAPQPKLSAVIKPRVLRTGFNPDNLPLPNTVVILQTTRYESAGREIWTLSVWRVGGNNWSERQLESAWIVSSI